MLDLAEIRTDMNTFDDGASKQYVYYYSSSSSTVPLALVWGVVLLANVGCIVIFFICRCCCLCCRFKNRGRVIAHARETALSSGQSNHAYPTTGSYISGNASVQYPIGNAPYPALSYPTGGHPYPTSAMSYPTALTYPNATTAPDANGEHLYLQATSKRSEGGGHEAESKQPLISLTNKYGNNAVSSQVRALNNNTDNTEDMKVHPTVL